MIKVTLACLASLCVGTGIGWLRGSSAAETRIVPTGSAAASVVALQTTPTTSNMIDLAQLRAMMREELAAARTDGQGNVGSAATPVKEIPATPELVAQRREAVADIETMISGAQWGNEQRAGFQQRLSMLDPEQGQRMLRAVTAAINDGRVQVSTDGPPL